MKILVRIMVILIRIYQRAISPFLGVQTLLGLAVAWNKPIILCCEG